MKDQHDPVDSALSSLGGRRWPGEDHHNHQLKEKIMQKYKTSGSSVRHRGAIVATIAFLMLGTVGFGAAGGFEYIKSIFVTVTIDGVPVDLELTEIDVETDGNSATITLDAQDIDMPDVPEDVSISITATADTDARAIIETEDGQQKVIDLKVDDPQKEDDN